jgi:hypothetical protein
MIGRITKPLVIVRIEARKLSSVSIWGLLYHSRGAEQILIMSRLAHYVPKGIYRGFSVA